MNLKDQNEWEALKRHQVDTGGHQRAWSIMWNESAASALFRSAKLYSAAAGRMLARQDTQARAQLERVRKKFVTPKLHNLWSQRVALDVALEEQEGQSAAPPQAPPQSNPSAPPSPPGGTLDGAPADAGPSPAPSGAFAHVRPLLRSHVNSWVSQRLDVHPHMASQSSAMAMTHAPAAAASVRADIGSWLQRQEEGQEEGGGAGDGAGADEEEQAEAELAHAEAHGVAHGAAEAAVASEAAEAAEATDSPEAAEAEAPFGWSDGEDTNEEDELQDEAATAAVGVTRATFRDPPPLEPTSTPTRAPSTRRVHGGAPSLSSCKPAPVDSAFLQKLLFFEHLFFALDANQSGSVPLSDLSRLLSYLDFTESVAERERYIASGTADDNDDGVVDRFEFLEVCVDRLWNYDMGTLKQAAANFAVAQQVVASGPSRYWQEAGKAVDNAMAKLMPIVHVNELRMPPCPPHTHGTRASSCSLLPASPPASLAAPTPSLLPRVWLLWTRIPTTCAFL